jgi:FKBP-type peptidyl-prolyl cis-trans isomerase
LLTIPPRLAYGETGHHRLAGSTLVFAIDLLAVY